MRSARVIALGLVACLACACARNAPPAPVAHYGVKARAEMASVLRSIPKEIPPVRFARPASVLAKMTAGAKKAYAPVAAMMHPVVEEKDPDGFLWPVRGRILSAYGPKQGGLYNDGINIAAPKGTPVKAASGGTVAYVGSRLGNYGNLVLIRHEGGMMTAYAHLADVRVKEGEKVRKGEAIGAVGSTGAVASSQLHFEIRRKGDAVDPKRYLS